MEIGCYQDSVIVVAFRSAVNAPTPTLDARVRTIAGKKK